MGHWLTAGLGMVPVAEMGKVMDRTVREWAVGTAMNAPLKAHRCRDKAQQGSTPLPTNTQPPNSTHPTTPFSGVSKRGTAFHPIQRSAVKYWYFTG